MLGLAGVASVGVVTSVVSAGDSTAGSCFVSSAFTSSGCNDCKKKTGQGKSNIAARSFKYNLEGDVSRNRMLIE